MQLMTAEIEKALMKFPIGSQDEKGGNAKIVVKYFGGSAATWLITEGEKQGNGDWLLFGYMTLGHMDFIDPSCLLWEWGYVTLNELQGLRFPPFGLPTERDTSIVPGRSKVKDVAYMSRDYPK